jgi:hypothetical protein
MGIHSAVVVIGSGESLFRILLTVVGPAGISLVGKTRLNG